MSAICRQGVRQRDRKTENVKRDIGTILDGIVGVVMIAGTVVLSAVLAGWYRKWRATEQEAERSLPGDELVPKPRSEITAAVTVRAPVRIG